MAISPLRKLGEIGVITDVNPYDLPVNAVSMAVNVRFNNGMMSRSPVFRDAVATTQSNPVFTFSYEASPGNDVIFIADSTGTLYSLANGSQTNVTDAGFTPASSTIPYTSTSLAGVVYINRQDQQPRYFGSASTTFASLPNWLSTWRCRSLRSFKSFLIALNVQKSGVSYPNMVKWSDITLYGTYPASWDSTDPTKSAGENTLAEMKSGILDGAALRDFFVVYGPTSSYLMEYTADSDIFRFRKLFDNQGIIGTNCVVEVDGLHYVFGDRDIYVHDGTSVKRIANNRVRNFIYDNLNTSKADNFFVFHNVALQEVNFCYVSGDGYAGFSGTTYCNRSAVYNYANDTWTFYDLPNVGVGCYAKYSTSTTYTNATTTYDTVGGSYYDQEGAGNKSYFMPSLANTSVGLSDARILGFDPADNSILSLSAYAPANKPAYAERIGIDLDELRGVDIRTYKVIRAIYPEVEVVGASQTLNFAFSGTTTVQQQVAWGTESTFNPRTQYKIDLKTGGRFLGWYVESLDNNDFTLSGYDVDIVLTGKR